MKKERKRKQMKISVLVENTSSCQLSCEHGLSLMITYNEEELETGSEGKRESQADRKLLLDAGTTELFAENAEEMGISFDDVEVCVLSHGHYDHSGGFTAFFEKNKKAKVYAQESAFRSYYAIHEKLEEIGIPEKVLEQKERFEAVSSACEILPGVFLVPHTTSGLETIGERAKLYKKQGEAIVPDDFAHEQSLVFHTKKGLVIFNSCSHGGVAAIIREAKAACGDVPVYAYIGGLHMKGKTAEGEEICTFTPQELDELCELIKKEKISVVYTGHCTGLPGFDELKKRLGDTILHLTTGLQFAL